MCKIGKQLTVLLGLVLIAGAGARASILQSPTIVGTVRTDAGRAIHDIMVQGCTTTVCLVTRTDAAGRFSISGLTPPVRVAVKTPQDDTVSPWRAEAIAPLNLVTSGMVDIGTLYVPTLPKPVTLQTDKDLQTIALPDGLSLTLHRSDLKIPALAAHADKLSARLIPLKQAPRFDELGSEKIIALYALYPFASKSTSSIAVRAKTSLPAGTKVQMRTINELDGTLSEPHTGTSDGRFIKSDEGAGISSLTWLIISR
jgi:hypothetical protein